MGVINQYQEDSKHETPVRLLCTVSLHARETSCPCATSQTYLNRGIFWRSALMRQSAQTQTPMRSHTVSGHLEETIKATFHLMERSAIFLIQSIAYLYNCVLDIVTVCSCVC